MAGESGAGGGREENAAAAGVCNFFILFFIISPPPPTNPVGLVRKARAGMNVNLGETGEVDCARPPRETGAARGPLTFYHFLLKRGPCAPKTGRPFLAVISARRGGARTTRYTQYNVRDPAPKTNLVLYFLGFFFSSEIKETVTVNTRF